MSTIELANSVTEFSTTQGQNNWYYGYYDGPFTSSDFQLMTQNDDYTWAANIGPYWGVAYGTYWTILWATGAHGNGTITGDGRLPVEQWAVRRYISEVDGTINIAGNISKQNTNGGNGILGHIIVDGKEIWNQYISANDGVGVNYQVNVKVKKGSTIDFALDPYLSNDRSDGSNFTATIFNLDPSAISIKDFTLTEGNSGVKQANFNVKLSKSSQQPITVDYTTANDTAASGSDYVPTAGTLTFSPGQTSKNIQVPIIGDSNIELNETFFVNLTNAVNAAITDSQAVGTITTDDGTVPLISIADLATSEGNSSTKNALFLVKLNSAINKPVTVNYATQNDGAIAPSDYLTKNGTLTFAAGQTVKTISVEIKGDRQPEKDESFKVNLSGANNAAIEDNQAIGTIINDDGAFPKVSIKDVTLTEGNSGLKQAGFVVSLDKAAQGPVSVNYSTFNGTATAGQDYITKNGSLTFTSGQKTKTINVPVKGDLQPEANEKFTLKLSNPSLATISDSEGIATIINDDVPSISISSVAIAEGQTGTKQAKLTLSLSATSISPVKVSYKTKNGTASSPSDYLAENGLIVFNPGQKTKTIDVAVKGDKNYEQSERFFVELFNPQQADLLNPQGTVTILNDDPITSLSNSSALAGLSETEKSNITPNLDNYLVSSTERLNYPNREESINSIFIPPVGEFSL